MCAYVESPQLKSSMFTGHNAQSKVYSDPMAVKVKEMVLAVDFDAFVGEDAPRPLMHWDLTLFLTGETVAEQPEATAEAAENAAAAETRIAPAASGIQICTAVTTQAHQATSDVQRALDQASDMASQLKAINDASSAACATETDRVITQTEKENSSDAAADMFRRRREVAQAREDVLNLQASKMPRLL